MHIKYYVHDRIVFLGGAEALCSDLIRHFGVTEQTRLFALYSIHDTFVVDEYQIPIVTALPRRMNKLFAWGMRTDIKIGRWLFDYRNLMFFYPLLCWLLRQKIQQAQPNELIISSFATAKNVVPVGGRTIPTILYMHSPMQYIRENYTEYMQKLGGLKRILFGFAASYLRPWDVKKRLYTKVYANSIYTVHCVKKYYSIEATVRYPKLSRQLLATAATDKVREYMVYVGRLVKFIREVDRIIELCNRLQLPLLILGSGPDELYLKSIAGPTIVFVGQVSDHQEKIEIVRHAKGLINLAKESCGMATMEALALGVPVFGYAEGGTYELMTHDGLPGTPTDAYSITGCGVLVNKKTPEVLDRGMHIFLHENRKRKYIQDSFQQRFRAQPILA